MENRHVSALLRRVSRQMNRRAALASLLGGALLLRDPATSDATKEAERRKHRRRKQARAATVHKGVSIIVDNTAGTRSVIVGPGAVGEGMCCAAGFAVTIPAGGSRTFDTHFSTGWIFINGKYWFQFTNPLIGRPYLAIALGGRFIGHNVSCCQGAITGSTVEYLRTMAEGDTRTYDIRGPVFTVTRNRDKPRHKLFTVKLPATI